MQFRGKFRGFGAIRPKIEVPETEIYPEPLDGNIQYCGDHGPNITKSECGGVVRGRWSLPKGNCIQLYLLNIIPVFINNKKT